MNQMVRISGRIFKGRLAKEVLADIAVYLFIFLFFYTASSKLMDMETFTRVLSRSVLFENFPIMAGYGTPLIEMVVSAMLIIPRTRQAGLYMSLLLMIIFTSYLLYMVLFSDVKTCHCGGVISAMSWKQHILFNLIFVALAVIGIKKHKRVNHQFSNTFKFFQL